MGRLRLRAHSSLASNTAEAPSVSGVELPAVSVPWPLRRSNAGLSVANFSTVLSARTLLSMVRPWYSLSTRSLKKPRFQAAPAFTWLSVGERILVGARDLPGLGHLLAVLAHRQARCAARARRASPA